MKNALSVLILVFFFICLYSCKKETASTQNPPVPSAIADTQSKTVASPGNSESSGESIADKIVYRSKTEGRGNEWTKNDEMGFDKDFNLISYEESGNQEGNSWHYVIEMEGTNLEKYIRSEGDGDSYVEISKNNQLSKTEDGDFTTIGGDEAKSYNNDARKELDGYYDALVKYLQTVKPENTYDDVVLITGTDNEANTTVTTRIDRKLYDCLMGKKQ